MLSYKTKNGLQQASSCMGILQAVLLMLQLMNTTTMMREVSMPTFIPRDVVPAATALRAYSI